MISNTRPVALSPARRKKVRHTYHVHYSTLTRHIGPRFNNGTGEPWRHERDSTAIVTCIKQLLIITITIPSPTLPSMHRLPTIYFNPANYHHLPENFQPPQDGSAGFRVSLFNVFSTKFNHRLTLRYLERKGRVNLGIAGPQPTKRSHSKARASRSTSLFPLWVVLLAPGTI